MAERPCESAPEGLVTSPTRLPCSTAKFVFSSSSMPSDTAARPWLAQTTKSPSARAALRTENRKGIAIIQYIVASTIRD